VKYIEKSLEWHKRAERVIPGASQVLSKQYGRLIQGVAPPFIRSGWGSHIWDYDSNEYIDWSAALGPVIIGYDTLLGYNNFLSPLNHHLEVELAEKLVDIIPCAEMVRFFKSGSESTSAAIRLSRAITGRTNVLCCGYHGWHDWYSSTLPIPRSSGVAHSDVYKTIKIEYGNTVELERLLDFHKPACFILEPINRQCPEKASRDYLLEVRKLCDKYGVILIFDEIVSGFRYSISGGQGLFHVYPDLACYSKAMANGYAISALVGKKDLMKEITPLQISGTFFNESAPIKASLQTIDFIEKYNVINSLWGKSNILSIRIEKLIEEYNLDEVLYLKGYRDAFYNYAPWSSFVWDVGAFYHQCYFLQETIKRGIFYNRDHYFMYYHSMEDINRTLEVYEEIFCEFSEYTDPDYYRNSLVGIVDRGLFP